MKRIRPGAAALLLAIAVAAICTLEWVWWHRWLPGWAVAGLAAVGAVALFLAARWLETGESENDPLRRWREYRVAKVLTFAARGERECTLDLEIFRDANFDGRSVTLRFHGVAGLRIVQLGDHPLLLFDYLIAEDRGPEERSKRYVVRDAWNEALSFTCDSLEDVSATVRVAAS